VPQTLFDESLTVLLWLSKAKGLVEREKRMNGKPEMTMHGKMKEFSKPPIATLKVKGKKSIKWIPEKSKSFTQKVKN